MTRGKALAVVAAVCAGGGYLAYAAMVLYSARALMAALLEIYTAMRHGDRADIGRAGESLFIALILPTILTVIGVVVWIISLPPE